MRIRAKGVTSEAIERVYREHLHSFLKVAAGVAGEQAAADIVHASFVRALRYGRSFHGGSLEAWLWRIVVNEARNSYGLQTRGASSDEIEQRFDVAHESSGELAIQAAVLRLPLRQREVVFLRYFADLDYQSIAQVLGIRPGTVAASLHAAHDSIRKTLIEETRCAN